MATWLHKQRLSAVREALLRRGAQTVLDLGCGDGPLLTSLAEEPAIRRIVGVEVSEEAVQRLRTKVQAMPEAGRHKVNVLLGDITERQVTLGAFDAVILVETIEHLNPDRLSRLERKVFADCLPATVVITTPNRDFNGMLGVPGHRLRHRGHLFEWGRARFRAWATGVAQRNGYRVAFGDVAGAHADYGGATQMAVFERLPVVEARIA
jgi:small RNA 2'-O-methyltransferase